MASKKKRKYTRKEKSVTSPFFSGQIGASSVLDAWGKTRAPTPYELVIESLDTAYSCSTLNAEATASTKLRLYVRTTRRNPTSKLMARGDVKNITKLQRDSLIKNTNVGRLVDGSQDVKEVTEHPMLDLLDHPTGKDDNATAFNRFILFETIQRYLEIVGRAHLYVEQDGPGGTPSSLWILPSHLVQEFPDMSGNKVISEYFYASGAKKTRYTPEEVISFRFVDLATGGYIGGFSPLRACFESAKIFRMFSAHTNAVLRNGGRPAAMWCPSGTEGYGIGTDEAKRMQSAFRQVFAQAGAGSVMVSRLPGTIEMLEWPMDKLVNSEQYKLTKVSIANCFNVPSTILDRSESNLASAKTGDYAHARYAVVPRLRRIEATLNTFYIPYWDKNSQLFFAYDEPESLFDDAAESEKWKNARNNGAITANEDRLSLGLEEVPWGEQAMVQANMVAIDMTTGIPLATERPQPNSINIAPNKEEKPVVPIKIIKSRKIDNNFAQKSASILKLQQEYLFGNINREMAINNAVVVLGFSKKDAELLFIEKAEEKSAGASESSSGGGGNVTPIEYGDEKQHQNSYEAALKDDAELDKKVPQPEKDEEKDHFISRCVSNPELVNSYDDPTQRLGICYSTWRKEHPKDK